MVPQPSTCASRTLLRPAKWSAKAVGTSNAAIGCRGSYCSMEVT